MSYANTREGVLQRYEEIVRAIGRGFHPDTPADDYVPPLPPDLADYDEVLDAVFALEDVDPYGVALDMFVDPSEVEG